MNIQEHFVKAKEVFLNCNTAHYYINIDADIVPIYNNIVDKLYFDRNMIIHIDWRMDQLYVNPVSIIPSLKNSVVKNVIQHLKTGGLVYFEKHPIKENAYALHNENGPAIWIPDVNQEEFFIYSTRMSCIEWQEHFNLSDEEITMMRIKYPNWS